MPNEVELQNQINKLKKDKRRLRRWSFFHGFSLTGIVIIYIINHWLLISPSFVGSNYDDVAIPKSKNFRKGLHLPNRSMGVYYKYDDVKKYLNEYWDQLINRQKRWQNRPGQTTSFPYDNYTWMIGFYWMEKDRKNMFSANRHDFYVIPTLVDIRDSLNPKVIDYFDDKDSIYYHGTKSPDPRPADKSRVLDTENAVAFDEGQLWP